MKSPLCFALAAGLVLAGCPEEKKSEPAPRRFAAVKRSKRSEKAARIFCEKSYAAGAKTWKLPPEQPLPVKLEQAPVDEKGWQWINFWASWCKPCLEEMPLLGKWQETLQKEGAPITFQLWTIDEDREALIEALKNRARFPEGRIHWLEDADEIQSVADALGIDKNSAIPIHALVDPSGSVRCVRVGSVGANDYGTVKTIIKS